MENRKKLERKHFILIGVFFFTAILTFFTMQLDAEEVTYTNMSEATLPTISFVTDNGKSYNTLHGYAQEIDPDLDNEYITPIGTDRHVKISINSYGTNVKKIHYKVRDLDNNELYENTELKDFTLNNDYINADFTLKNLIDDNKRYSLEIILSLDNDKEAHYYATFIKGDSYPLEDYINFALNFNSASFDSTRSNEISSYLETSSSNLNDNFGHVDITSSSSMITWGDMEPYLEGEIAVSVKEINSDYAVICLDYRMGAQNLNASYDTYKVSESYRLRKAGSKFYLLNYERNANQIFDAKNALASSNKIDLGIKSDTDVVMKSDKDGKYNYFVDNGTLWLFSTDDSYFTRVFSFTSQDSDNVREEYDAHDIRIINVEDNGDVTFVVRGYMNRGEHEGEVGISLYKYKCSDNKAAEYVFIPLNSSYNMIKENTGGIAYLNENKFYCLVDNTLYSIDASSLEVMEVVTDLVEGTYAVSDDGSTICYSTNGDLYNTDTLRIYNMSNSSDYEIKAEDGDCLKVIGFIDGDCVYGVAHKSDTTANELGEKTLAMYKVEILNSEYQVIKNYESDGVYVTSAEVDGKRVTLNRASKTADGFVNTSIDQLINKDENVIENQLSMTTSYTAARLTENKILLFKKASNLNSPSLKASDKIVYSKKKLVDLDATVSGESKYYIYSFASFENSSQNINTAISKAYQNYGYVLDNNSKIVYKRYRNTSASISNNVVFASSTSPLASSVQTLANYAGLNVDIGASMATGQSVIDSFNQAGNIHLLSINGANLDDLLSYVSSGVPLVAKTADSYLIITAYDSENVSYIDVSNGARQTKTTAAVSKEIAEAGNSFITYYK